MPNRRSHRARWLSSWVLAGVYSLLGIAYLFPDEFVRNPDPAKRTAKSSVVAFIENLTVVPVWGILFIITGITLMGALLIGRRNADQFVPYPLLLGLVTFSMYSFASWSTTIINSGTYMVSSVLATGLTGVTGVLMYNYSRKPTVLDVAADDPNMVTKAG